MRHVALRAGILAFVLVAFTGCGESFKYEVEPVDEQNPVVKIQTSEGDIFVELFEKDAPKTVANFIGLAEGTIEHRDPKTQEKRTDRFYDGLTFHRVIKNFMIQGGCPVGNGTGSPGFKFEDEINAVGLGLDTVQVAEAPYATMDAQRYVAEKMNIRSQQEFEKQREAFMEAFGEAQQMSLLELYQSLGYAYDSTLNSHQAVRGSLAMANSGPNTNGSQFFINHADTPHLNGKHTVFGKVVKGMDVLDAICEVPVQPGSNKPNADVVIESITVVKKSGASS